jgi:hypothetical protein
VGAGHGGYRRSDVNRDSAINILDVIQTGNSVGQSWTRWSS